MENTASSNLYSWFEKSGILSNVRTHLRQNLINALKNRDLDLKRDSAPKSAKQYIYDLLIAEYLFNHNYAYTLSVFASEAPMLVNFPTNAQSAEENQNKLQEDYILHTLETLGINPQSSKGRYIVSEYLRHDTPLLLCILKSLSMSFAIRANVEDRHVCDKHTQTEDPRRLYGEDEAKLLAMKKRIIQQKRVFDDELKRREAVLKEQAVIMNEQLHQLDEKFDEVQTVMRAISLKEKELNDRMQNEENTLQKHLELTCREKQLLVEANRRFEEDLLKLQDQLSRVEELPSKKAAIVKTVQVQTENIIDTGKDIKIESLTKEKEELNKLVKDQQLRIEQITQRALQLSRQVEDIHSLRPTSDTETPMKATTTVISETSSTEDILQDAKSRLRRLEEESLKADQYYYKFINSTS